MANGKRIKNWNENQVLDGDFEIGVDKDGLVESEKTKLQNLKDFVIGKDAQKRIFADIKVSQGYSIYDLNSRVGKQFIDYSHFNQGNVNSANHYRHILWDIYDGTTKIYDAGKFASITALRIWLNDNISLSGGLLSNDVHLIAYLKETLIEKKLTNLQGYNKAYSFLKSNGDLVDYNNNGIRHLNLSGGTFNQLVLDVWENLLTNSFGIISPTTTDGSEVWLTSVRKNLYNALPIFNAYYKAPYLFNQYETKGRKVWVPNLNSFVPVNDILQNFQDPMYLELVNENYSRQNAVIISDINNYQRYDRLQSMYMTTIDFLIGSMVRFYLLKGSYYDGTNYQEFYALTVRPLGQDLFYTRYYDNSVYSLYAILKNNAGKDKLRKLNATYIGDKNFDKGWELDKPTLRGILTNHQNQYEDRNGKFFPDIHLVVMNELTGEISPLPNFKIAVKTRMRGSGFNLMIENK